MRRASRSAAGGSRRIGRPWILPGVPRTAGHLADGFAHGGRDAVRRLPDPVHPGAEMEVDGGIDVVTLLQPLHLLEERRLREGRLGLVATDVRAERHDSGDALR